MIRMGVVLILLLALGVISTPAALAQEPGFELVEKKYALTESDGAYRNLVIEHFKKDGKNGPTFQIWIADKNELTSRTLLQGDSMYQNEVLVSPDGRRIAINTKEVSNLASVHFYKQSEGLHYQHDEAAEKAADFWSFFARDQGWKSEIKLDHSYARAVAWAGDSSALLCSLTGYWAPGGDIPKGSVRAFYGVFDFKSMKFTSDLKVMNRGAVALRDGQNGSK